MTNEQPHPAKPLRIVAADDSAAMRRMLRTLFDRHAADPTTALPPMELCAVAADGEEALHAVERLRPDLLLLDLEMPRLGGLGVLDHLRATAPALPVILCSAPTRRGALATLDAFRHGVSDYVIKPAQQTGPAAALDLLAGQLLPRIAALAAPAQDAAAPLAASCFASCAPPPAAPGITAHEPAMTRAWLEHPARAGAPRVDLVVLGVSTGGPAALELMLPMLPADLGVPVMIVQHMPRLFTGVLAQRLDKLCRARVAEAHAGARLCAGEILLAPGDAHMEVAPLAASASMASSIPGALCGCRPAQVRLHQGSALHSCRPSVDYLFQSAARMYGAGTLAVVLTGMGCDGLDGARAVHAAGGTVLAQDERSSAVWGMPGRVARAGLAAATLPLRDMAAAIARRVQHGRNPVSAAQAVPSDRRREVRYGLL